MVPGVRGHRSVRSGARSTLSGTPHVSVYLPTRNRPDLLRQAVESVQYQSFRDFEILIVDDGSDDGDTPQTISALAADDPRIRSFRLDTPSGAPAARNLAIRNARGRFLTGIDDDDLMLPRRLESMLEAGPERYSLVCSSFFVEKNGFRRRYNARAREITLPDMLHQNVIDNQAMMLTERVLAVDCFDESLVASQDYDLWTRLIERFGPAMRITEPTYVRREGISANAITWSPRFAEGARQFTQKHRPKMNSAQLRSQALLHKITAREPIALKDVGRCLSWPTAALLLRYMASRSKFLRDVLGRR